MLAQRSIKLHTQGKKLHQSVIPREVLADCGRAEALLERAQHKANAMLAQAEADREQRLAELQQSFLSDADACLKRWEEERCEMWEHIEQYASQLSQAMMQELLHEFSDAQKIKALALKLSKIHNEPVSATIQCSPNRFDTLAQLLQQQPQTPWHPIKNDQLSDDELCLVTDTGEYMLSWKAILAMVSTI